MIDINTVLFVNKYLYIDYWTFVHIIVVALLTFLLYKKSKDWKLNTLIILAVIIIYEVVEPSFPFFTPEVKLDAITDIIVGIITYALVALFLKVKNG